MSDNPLQSTRLGTLPRWDGEDVSTVWTLSLDVRDATGSPQPVEDGWLEPGVAQRAVYLTTEGFHPVGEIRFTFRGREVRLVGELTGRADVWELTPAMLDAMSDNPEYRDQIVAWLGV